MAIFLAVLIVILGPAFVSLVAFQAYRASHVVLAPFSNPGPEPRTFGSTGNELTYVVMGDSTAAGQGAPYDQGIAVQTAFFLAKENQVALINVAQTGARAADMLKIQLPQAIALKPDIVLISVGANDVTHLTPPHQVAENLQLAIQSLVQSNDQVRIIMTAVSDMGTVELFPQPLKALAGLQSVRVNKALLSVIAQQHVTLAPIARQASPYFAKDPSLYSADRFHPNKRGYAIWVTVINQALQSSK